MNALDTDALSASSSEVAEELRRDTERPAPGAHGLSEDDRKELVQRYREERARAVAAVAAIDAELASLGEDVPELFMLDGGIGILLPAGADRWTREEGEAAYAVIVQGGDDVRRRR